MTSCDPTSKATPVLKKGATIYLQNDGMCTWVYGLKPKLEAWLDQTQRQSSRLTHPEGRRPKSLFDLVFPSEIQEIHSFLFQHPMGWTVICLDCPIMSYRDIIMDLDLTCGALAHLYQILTPQAHDKLLTRNDQTKLLINPSIFHKKDTFSNEWTSFFLHI